MIFYKNRKIIYSNGKDSVVLLNNTTEERFAAFEALIKRKYGDMPELGVLKEEIIHL